MSYTLIRHLRRSAYITYQLRWESTLTNASQEDLVLRPPFTQWSKIIREAEKIVGYPTSFMNLRWLLSDEFSNMALYLRKLVGSNHPLLQTAKNVLYNENNHLQPWGLIILLLSKAVSSTTNSLQDSATAEHQRVLAELTEMIRTGNLVHKGLINIPVEEKKQSKDTAMFGNKIAILIGDYLLVTANGMLARLKNQDLSYIISTALRDLSEGEFYGDRDEQNMPLPSEPYERSLQEDSYQISSDMLPIYTANTLGYPIREWTVRALLSGGSLLGRGCQGATLLAKQPVEMQEYAYHFGCHLCLAWQAANELQKLSSNNKDIFSLVSAPVLFALNDSPVLYEKIRAVKQNRDYLDYESFKLDILKTDAVERTQMLYKEHSNCAKMYAEKFGDNQSVDTIKTLINIIFLVRRRRTRSSHTSGCSSEDLDWRHVISEAENIVGYPTSFLNLRWLLNDEIANTAVQLRKLIGSNHPIFKTAKNLILNPKSNLQSVGLIILLLSKAAGFDKKMYLHDQHDSGILYSQRGLAEIVEMKRTGHLLHKVLCNLQGKDGHEMPYKELLQGNKAALLSGDFFLATSLKQLGGLRNQEVTELISSGLRDLVEGEFFGESNNHNQYIPAKPKGVESKGPYDWQDENNLKKMGNNDYLGQSRDEWLLRTMLDSGSILAKGCQAAMKLAGKERRMEKEAYKLGGHLAIIWRLYIDIKEFSANPKSFSYVGAPVMYALWEYPTIYGYFLEAKLDNQPASCKELYYAVKSTRAMEYLRESLDEELDAILRCVKEFSVEEAKVSLQKMARSIHAEALLYMD